MRLITPSMSAAGAPGPTTTERGVCFSVGSLFYNPSSRIIRDLGVLALAVLGRERAQEGGAPLRVLDAMAGSGVRSLRYATEVSNVGLVHANELMKGDHPLSANLAPLISKGIVQLTAEDAIDMYFRARLSGDRYDFVDCDAFGTGQPHTAEAWWAVATGGLLYLCATDSRCTAGHNAHKVMSGYAAVAKYNPSCNEQGLRLLLGAAWREAAQRNLHARPIFSYFDRPSSSFRVMLQLTKPKRPPADAYESLSHVARCRACGQLWKVPSVALGDAAGALRPKCAAIDCGAAGVDVAGPMWSGPMHDETFVHAMEEEAAARGWGDAEQLLRLMCEEARAEMGGALLFYHLGEVQRSLAARGLRQPPLAVLIDALRAAGHTASPSHSERKAIKVSATLDQIVEVVAAAERQGESK